MAKGRAESYAQAYAQAYVEARTGSVVRVLEQRGIAVSEAERERVLGCADMARLDVWLARSLTVRAAAEIFEPGDD
ncbi:hypothetical protein [Actinomadura sp. WMMA1423]|uniref:hypothetical protein n=1 Tax=Actinomadura sp. WMMA1423 TaxID=2591108 RepID=UPI001146A144|nr:hypothetical protein [Actinomadura sp. WMMA1423]